MQRNVPVSKLKNFDCEIPVLNNEQSAAEWLIETLQRLGILEEDAYLIGVEDYNGRNEAAYLVTVRLGDGNYKGFWMFMKRNSNIVKAYDCDDFFNTTREPMLLSDIIKEEAQRMLDELYAWDDVNGRFTDI